MTITEGAARGARRASIATAIRDLDHALARNVRLEVEAHNWRIKSGQWRQKYEHALAENDSLKAQLEMALAAGTELIRMVDALRAEQR